MQNPHLPAMNTEIQSQQKFINLYSISVWTVPKKTDAFEKKKFRMVIDYRKLNEETIEEKYPFHQIEMDLRSIEKTRTFWIFENALRTKNTSLTFQRMIEAKQTIYKMWMRYKKVPVNQFLIHISV